MSDISGLATDIFEREFDETGVTFNSISGWLNENVGRLNNYLYTSFSGNGATISGMGLEEEAYIQRCTCTITTQNSLETRSEAL